MNMIILIKSFEEKYVFHISYISMAKKKLKKKRKTKFEAKFIN